MKTNKIFLYSLMSFLLFFSFCKEVEKEMAVKTGLVSDITGFYLK